MGRIKRLLLLLCLLMVAAGAAGQTKAKPDKIGKTEAELLALDRAWADAIARGDMTTIDRLFAPEFVIVSPNGELKNKQQEINNLKPALDVTTYYFRSEDTQVRVYKDAAVLTGRAVWKVRYKGRDIDNNRRYTTTYIKRSGRWQMVAQQISGNIAAPATQ